jgi:anti-anti-sigma factor
MNSTTTKLRTTLETIQLTELVRGQDEWLLERVMPLVSHQDVCLDLSSVERIDAAGIAALISLYSIANSTGHFFTICGASQRVVEILALVGLDGILLSHNAVINPHSGSQFERPAA